jgi:MFS family permease
MARLFVSAVVRRELIVLSLYQMLANNRGGLFLVFFPIYLASIGASAPFALAIVSVGYVAASLVAPLVGRWSDRLGRRKPFLLVAEAGALPIIIAIPFLSTPELAGAAFIAAQIVLAVGSPSLNAFVSDLTKDAERAEGYAWLNGAGYAGSIVGLLVTGILVSVVGIEAFIWFTVAVMVGTITIVAVWVPDARVTPSPKSRPLSEMREVATFSLTVSIRALGAGAMGAFYGLFAVALGATGFDVAVIGAVAMGAGAVLSLPAGRAIDRRGEIWGIFFGTLLTLVGIGFFLLGAVWTTAPWPVVIPAQTFRIIGVTFLSPGMLSWVSHRAPPGRRAEYLGFFSLINSTMWSLGPLAGGAVYSLGQGTAIGGDGWLFVFALATTLVSVVAIEGIYVRKRRRARAGPAGAAAGPTDGAGPANAVRAATAG